MTEVIAIIPARGGSKGLPNKNLLPLDGHPLIARPIIHMKESGVNADILVSTDSEEIQKVANAYGAQCPFLRPSELAQDRTTTEETLKFALSQAELYYKKTYSLCIFLTATDVHREPEWIAECYDQIVNNSDLESLFIGYSTTKNFWEFDNGSWQRLRPWMRQYSSRQLRRSIVREDTGVCCISRASLWRQGKRIGDNVSINIKEHNLGGLDIHTRFDLDLSDRAIRLHSYYED